MTKSTITREESVQAVFDLKVGYRLRFADIEILKRVARMALAAMDGEPDCNERKLFCSTDTARMRKAISVSAGTDVAQPYRHAQPESECEKLAIENLRSTMEGIGHIRRTLEETFGGLHGTHVEPDVLAECKAICDAIYAAYGHAKPASVVPGKWIPVSERMPEVGDIVLTAMGAGVTTGETECSAANCRFFTSVISGRELPATHWMPLPAGPQGVKGE